MAEKRPAYQRYPKDYLSDENVALMSLEQEGAYNRLMDYCWLQGSIPSDMTLLARLCRITLQDMVRIWPGVERCFRKQGDRYTHPRLDVERQKQDTYRKMKSDAGRAGAKAKWDKEKGGSAINLPMAKDGFSSSFASATPVEGEPKRGEGSQRSARKTTVPDGWEASDRHREKAEGYGVDVDLEAEKFLAHHEARGNRFVSWDRAFDTWLLKAREFAAADRAAERAADPRPHPYKPLVLADMPWNRDGAA